MSSVTQRIKEIKQPYGGYLKPSLFKKIVYKDEKILNEENVHASIIGMAVDYLTRYMMGTSKENAFDISIRGYQNRIMILGKDVIKNDRKEKKDIETLLNQINGLDDKSIIAVCKLCTYDVWYRNTMNAFMATGATSINPDENTIENIKIMVERSISFWKLYGPIIKDGFTFEGGYTKTVDAGDGDFLTKDTLWDYKVSKTAPTNKHTLQLLMYWIMGKHSKKIEFENIDKIGIFNPRLNVTYLYEMKNIPEETIEIIEKEVIGY